MITIENRTRRLLSFQIPIAIGGGQRIATAVTTRGADALRGPIRLAGVPKVEVRLVPTTLTLAAKQTPGSISAPLPDGYQSAPDIVKAHKAGQIAIHKVEAQPAPVHAAPQASAEEAE